MTLTPAERVSLDRSQLKASDVEVTQNAVERLAGIESDMMTKAQQIADDPRFSAEHKAQEVNGMVSQAADLLAREAAEYLTALQPTYTALEKQARLSIAPTPDQAAQLVYTRDALAIRWQAMTEDEIYTDWQNALKYGDSATIRAYNDFVLPALQKGSKNGIVSYRYDDLRQQSENALLTDDQRKARQTLTELTPLVARLRGYTGDVPERLKSTRYDDSTNALTDGYEAQIRQRFKLR